MKTQIIKFTMLFILVCLAMPSLLFAQNVQKTITVKIEKQTLKKAIDIVQEESKYSFLVRNDNIDQNIKVSVDVKDGTINEVLDQMFNHTGIMYEVSNGRVVVYKKDTPSEIDKGSLLTIKGSIVDVNGEPLVGVNISNPSKTIGTISNVDGNFALSVPRNEKLFISYIGYVTLDIVVKDEKPIHLVLEETSKQIDEVVVVGYGVQKKANLTGAISTIKMDEVLGTRPVSSVQAALVGQIPNLQITKGSGTPGTGYTMTIRGATGTLNGNGGRPLILVDNVPMDLDMIDPEDVDEITVLKDAASSAIYGARAAFGVILVTTKKGTTNDKYAINYSNNFSFSTPWTLPKKASPYNTVKMFKDLGLTNHPNYSLNIDKWLGYIEEYNADPNKYPDGYVMDGGTRYNMKETDLFTDMMESHGFQQKHNISASGGGKKLSYRASMGYMNEDGIVVTNKDSYQRYNISSYLRSEAISWLIPELDFKYANAGKSEPTATELWGSAVMFGSYHPTGYVDIDGISYPVNTPRNMVELGFPNLSSTDNTRITGRVTIKPIKDFNIVGEYTYDSKNYEFESFNPIYDYVRGQDNTVASTTTPEESKYRYQTEKTIYKSLNVFGDYSLKLDKHFFKIMAGFSQESYSWAQRYITKVDMINQSMPSISGGVGEVFADDAFSEYTIRGGFFRFNYAYADRYLLEVNGRYDGSSKFPKDSRFGFFPSVSAGWRLSEESFMEWSRSVLTNLKLRGSWGNIGNQNIDPYAFIPGMGAGVAGWVVGDKRVYTLSAPGLVSSDFTWERVETLDFGVDIGLLDNRMSIGFDWYRRDTKGMLAQGEQLPTVLGASAPLKNVADLRTNGWELTVNWNDQIGKVAYNVGLSLSDLNTKITKYNNVDGLLGQYYVGKNVNEQWGYITDRFYTEDDFGEDGKVKKGIPVVEGYTPLPGDILYKDLDGDGLINNGKNKLGDSGDQAIIGDRTRHYQYGITGGLTWKGISFSFILQGVGKRDMWNSSELFWPYEDEWTTLYASHQDYWTPENLNAYYPRIYSQAKGNTPANRFIQTKYKLNGAYLNLKNITLSYAFPKTWISKFNLNNLSVYFSGEDLYSFNHLKNGLDPEAGDSGRGWTYPFMRKFSFGLQIGL